MGENLTVGDMDIKQLLTSGPMHTLGELQVMLNEDITSVHVHHTSYPISRVVAHQLQPAADNPRRDPAHAQPTMILRKSTAYIQ